MEVLILATMCSLTDEERTEEYFGFTSMALNLERSNYSMKTKKELIADNEFLSKELSKLTDSGYTMVSNHDAKRRYDFE